MDYDNDAYCCLSLVSTRIFVARKEPVATNAEKAIQKRKR
jgi:hypothetical protein